MNLYLITRTEETDWDTYDAAVVAAEDEDQAVDISPRDGSLIDWNADCPDSTWATKRYHVRAKLIGIATPFTSKGVILASFNAG